MSLSPIHLWGNENLQKPSKKAVYLEMGIVWLCKKFEGEQKILRWELNKFSKKSIMEMNTSFEGEELKMNFCCL